MSLGKVTLLLDGLDEIAPHLRLATRDGLATILHKHNGCVVIVTSRIVGFQDTLHLPVFEILPLNDPQIFIFVQNWFWDSAQLANEFILQLRGSEAALQLMRTPLLLGVLCSSFERTGMIETVETKLYEVCLEQALGGWDRAKLIQQRSTFSKHLRELALQNLAFVALQDDLRLIPNEVVSKSLSQTLSGDLSSNIDALLEDLELLTGIIAPITMEHYAFVHLAIRDYLAAKYIVRHNTALQQKAHLHKPSWRETLRLTASISSHREELVGQALEAGQYYLAADCTVKAQAMGPHSLLSRLLARYRKSERRYFPWRQIDIHQVVDAFNGCKAELEARLCQIIEQCRDGAILYGAFLLADLMNTDTLRKAKSEFIGGGCRIIYGDDHRKKMVWIPEGETLIGGEDIGQEGQLGQRPALPVFVSGFWIDVHAVTNREYELFNPTHVRGLKSSSDNSPVVAVTWYDAYMFAIWVGGDLPTERQWVRAASGPRNTSYAYGDTYDIAKARCGLTQPEATACDVMSYSANDFGVYDMSGNTWEWTADKFDEKEGSFGPETIKGGAWYSDAVSTQCRTRLRSLESGIGSDCGFRCCRGQ